MFLIFNFQIEVEPLQVHEPGLLKAEVNQQHHVLPDQVQEEQQQEIYQEEQEAGQEAEYFYSRR